MKRQERIERIRDVWSEYLVGSSAMTLLERKLHADPSDGTAFGWRTRDARSSRSSLGGTFLIRMFAEFEAGLRGAWENLFYQATRPPMRDLLASTCTRPGILDPMKIHADEVRVYRNVLVHQGDEIIDPVPLEEARSRLATILSRFPPDW